MVKHARPLNCSGFWRWDERPNGQIEIHTQMLRLSSLRFIMPQSQSLCFNVCLVSVLIWNDLFTSRSTSSLYLTLTKTWSNLSCLRLSTAFLQTCRYSYAIHSKTWYSNAYFITDSRMRAAPFLLVYVELFRLIQELSRLC